MNQIDLFKYSRFPLSAETIDFLQNMASVMAQAAGIAGDNYILSGCTETGGNVSDGIIVINGEIMPFVGGTKQTYIIIQETKRSVTAEGQVYRDIYITRQATFGTGTTQYAWANFERVLTIPELQSQIAGILPAGMVVMWAGDEVPEGWALCDGQNGTPNLTDKFVIAAGTEHPSGSTGGNSEIQLTEAQMPQHKHGAGTLGLSDATIANYLGYNNNTLSNHNNIDQGVTQENVSISGETDNAGNGDAIDIMPPYYSIAFIMKL